MLYSIQHGEQTASIAFDDIKLGNSFELKNSKTEPNKFSIHSTVKYDIVGKLAEGTQLTRGTVTSILKGADEAVFAQFKTNPESFITEAIHIINEQKATVIIEHLAYDPVDDSFDIDIFTTGQSKQDFSNAVKTPKHHIYDFVLPDSGSIPERNFAEALEASDEVVVYAKLPRGFLIPTPVGDYNPDWAIAFKEGNVKHIYFVAETKGSMSSMNLRQIEKAKISSARKFFRAINSSNKLSSIKYEVVDNFGRLMEIVKKE